jgi:hypothetical protein
LECVGVGQYSLIQKNSKTVVRTIETKNNIDAENQCQSIVLMLQKKCQRLNSLVSVETLKVNRDGFDQDSPETRRSWFTFLLSILIGKVLTEEKLRLLRVF